jgi:CheY-like chemotaxis protein
MARVLVIDDEVSVRNTIRLILENRGHHVVVAECGGAAWPQSKPMRSMP